MVKRGDPRPITAKSRVAVACLVGVAKTSPEITISNCVGPPSALCSSSADLKVFVEEKLESREAQIRDEANAKPRIQAYESVGICASDCVYVLANAVPRNPSVRTIERKASSTLRNTHRCVIAPHQHT